MSCAGPTNLDSRRPANTASNALSQPAAVLRCSRGLGPKRASAPTSTTKCSNLSSPSALRSGDNKRLRP
eukprot:92118-Alexandrium_andersonii.AAC.1